jgi:hypothetical protein
MLSSNTTTSQQLNGLTVINKMNFLTSNFTTTTSAQTQLLETILQMHPIDTTFFTPQTLTYATIATIWWLRIVCWYITTDDGGVVFQRILAAEAEAEREVIGRWRWERRRWQCVGG